MAVIFDALFTSGLDGFSAGTQVTSQGSASINDPAGALEVGPGVTTTRDFTGITSGITRIDFCFKEQNTTLATNASHLLYVLPNGAAVVSGSTAGCVIIDRESANGATASAVRLRYRDSTGFVSGTLYNVPKGPWYRITILSNWTTKTFSILLDDILLLQGLSWANSSAANIGRVAIAGSASAPLCYFDNIRVESDWAETESVLVDHNFVGGSGEIEASTPTIGRDAFIQPWYIAPDTANYGAFTLGASGATPDASRRCFALQRCAQNGIIEAEFETPSSGQGYIGIVFRMWDYLTNTGGGAGIIRVSTNATLFLPDRSGNIQNVASATQTLAASTIYTLRMEMRGRIYTVSIKAAAMDSGSYTTLFTHTVTSSVTGGRGMLIEELCGPFVDTSVGTATARRFRFTGKAEASQAVRTIGDWTWGVNTGSVKEAYYLDSAAPTRNLWWSRGIQYGHRSTADMVGFQQQQTIYDASNVYAVRQTAGNLTEYQHIGTADCYLTLLHRGPWVSDGILPTDTSENFAPDFDLKPNTWSSAFLTCINSGSATSRNDSPYHDWVNHNSNVNLPAGNQGFTAYGSGQEAHVSQVLIADGAQPSNAYFVTSKWEGNGDPISRAIGPLPTSLTANTALRVARCFLMRPASALDGATLTAWRDNLASPGTLTFATGSAKTDAAGDTGATGFNRRHGWHEITCAGGTAEWTLPVASGTRHMPVFRLWSWTNTNTGLSINGTAATRGTDYVIDDVGGGLAVLQVLSDRTSNTTFALAAGPAAELTGAASLGGIASTGTLTGGTASALSGAALLGGLVSSGTITSAAASTLSGAALLGGIVASGTIQSAAPFVITGAAVIGGLSMSGGFTGVVTNTLALPRLAFRQKTGELFPLLLNAENVPYAYTRPNGAVVNIRPLDTVSLGVAVNEGTGEMLIII